MNRKVNIVIRLKAIFTLGFFSIVFGAQGQTLEVDHLWIQVKSQSVTTQLLESAGLNISKSSIQGNAKVTHKGQGTAGIYVRFENIYLEFIWVENDSLLREVAPELGSTLIGFPETSPIGIGLCTSQDEPVDLPFPTTSYWAEWMRPLDGLAVAQRAIQTDPAIFVVPIWLNWKQRVRSNPNLLQDVSHQQGIRSITKIRISGPNHPSDSEAVKYLLDGHLVEFQNSEDFLLQLECDGGGTNSLDLRPELPLTFIY